MVSIVALGAVATTAFGVLIWRASAAANDWKPAPRTKLTVFATPIGKTPKGDTQLDGTCDLGSSEASNRPDAARCFTTHSDARGVNVFDPCFHSQAGAPGTLDLFLCPDDPWNKRVRGTVIAVHGGAGNLGEAPTSFRPWALLLANGQHCVAITGASGMTAGLRYNYGCFAPPFRRRANQPIGKTGGIVLGDPDQRLRTWTVLFAKDTTGSGFSPVRVARAYD